MAVGDFSALAPISTTLGTAAAVIATVPANEEWTLRLARAVCLLTSGTAPTVSAGLSNACNEMCANEVVSIPSATARGAKNIVGPDFVTLPQGTQVFARASAPNAVRLLLTGTKKQVA